MPDKLRCESCDAVVEETDSQCGYCFALLVEPTATASAASAPLVVLPPHPRDADLASASAPKPEKVCEEDAALAVAVLRVAAAYNAPDRLTALAVLVDIVAEDFASLRVRVSGDPPPGSRERRQLVTAALERAAQHLREDAAAWESVR